MNETLKFRRDLHKIPELGMNLPKTSSAILKQCLNHCRVRYFTDSLQCVRVF